MNQRFLPVRSLLLALMLTSTRSVFAVEVKAGDTVAAVWDNGEYYVVTVLAIGDGKVRVHRADGSIPVRGESGSKLEIPLENVHPFDKAKPFKVGDNVLAATTSSAYFWMDPAVITEVSGESYAIKLQNNTILKVARDRVIEQPVIPADEVEVKVMGPVKHPCKFRLKKPATIEQAFDTAGGWSGSGENGIPAKVCILKRHVDGKSVYTPVRIHTDRKTQQITVLDEAWKGYHLVDGDQIEMAEVVL